MKNNIKYIGIVFSLFLIAQSLKAQDYHYTNFDEIELMLNPALTGTFNDAKYRAAAQFRNQWRSVASKPFTTFSLGYDMPLNERWGVGAYLTNYDGAKVYNAFNFVVSGAYKIIDPKKDEHSLSTGMQIGVIYKNTNNLDLLFDNQYSSGTFNAELPSAETFVRFNKTMPEFNYGIYYEYTDDSKRYHPYAGISIFHITSPKESILVESTDSKLPRRFAFNGGSKFNITKQFDLNAKALYMMQGTARELVLGFLANYRLQGQSIGSYSMKEQSLQFFFGGNYRHQDAVGIILGLQYDVLRYKVSYDITTSTLNSVNNGRGAIEFSMVFQPKNGYRKRSRKKF
jgi:type IX secretion system PorP/SprF family membrane protein